MVACLGESTLISRAAGGGLAVYEVPIECVSRHQSGVKYQVLVFAALSCNVACFLRV